ncbi:methyltransferase [Sphingomonas sp. Root241]|nr:methyltransferase [Sphingomonas sp. Root241]
MRSELLEILRCPKSGEALVLEEPIYEKGRVCEGWLVAGDARYPIRDFIPRFVPASNYADNFGMQWNLFKRTQLDSHSGLTLTADRFWGATGWTVEDLAGEWVLDAGCGSGRFAEIALSSGANVVAIDYSSAVDACYQNLSEHPNLDVVQADIYALPFASNSFPYVYSLGVLQHTPDVHRAFRALTEAVKPGGRLCVDYYWKRLRTMLLPKYALRPITRRVPEERLLAFLQRHLGKLLAASGFVGRVPLIGRGLQRLVPVANYSGIYPLSEAQLREWALLDTFDNLAPRYDNPQSAVTARRWLEEAGFDDVEVLQVAHLVARGVKPTG